MEETKRSGIVLVVREDGRVLVTSNRRYGGWCLPGGKVEAGELPVQAAQREFREETGCHVELADLVYLAQGTSATETGRIVTMFLARRVRGTPRKVEEGTDVAWMTIKELQRTHPFARFYLQHLPNGIDHLKPTELLG